MTEIDKVLKHTKEIKFLEYLDFYADADVTITKDGDTYTYQFGETDLYPAAVVALQFDKQGRLKRTQCNCAEVHDDEEGYCVHEFAAYMEYYMAKHPRFDILEYVIKKQQKTDAHDIWLEAVGYEDFEDFEDFGHDFDDYGFLEDLGMSPEEIDDIANFDIGMVLEDMSKEEIIEKIREVCNAFPLVHFAIIQHLAMALYEENRPVFEDAFEDFLQTMTTNRKPS